MKIANAAQVMAIPAARVDAAKFLAEGERIFVEANTLELKGSRLLSADLQKHIEVGGNATTTLTMSKSLAKQLDVPGMAVGSVTGMFAGAAIGAILAQIKAVHPTSATVFEAACAVLGAAGGTAVGSGKFKVTPKIEDGSFGLEIAPVPAK